MALLFVQASPKLALGDGDMGRVAAIFAVSLFYLTAMYFAGLLLSTLTQRSATALVLAVFIWVGAVAIYPNAVAYAVDTLAPVRAQTKAAGELQNQIGELFRKEMKELCLKILGSEQPQFGYSSSSWSSGGAKGLRMGGFNPDKPEEAATKVEEFKKYFPAAQRLRIRYAEQIWTDAWAPVEEHMRRAAESARRLALLSPAGAYLDATAILARTDRGDYWHFLNDARHYRKQLIEHFEEERYFAERAWFDQDEKTTLEGLPRFREAPQDLWQSLVHAGPNLLVLGGFNLVCFLAAYWRFRRYDVG